MSRVKATLDHKRIQRLIWLVLTFFVLLGYSLQSVVGSAYYSMVMQTSATVSSPPVILEEGTAGTSTIYTNKTSAKVSVAAPAPAPTYYPSGYNVLFGTYLSGSVPSSVETVDTEYLIVESSLDFLTTGYTSAFIGYRSNTSTNLLSSPKNRAWNGTTWDASETEMPTAGSPIRWVRVAYSPLEARYYEKIVVTLSDDGYLDAYVWNGASWMVTNNIGNVSDAAIDRRSFNIEYEKTSGDALLVYYNSPDASAELGYKIWNGTAWSSEYTYDLVAGSKVEIGVIAVAQNPISNSNEIALICTDKDSKDAYGIIWDGDTDAFGNQYQLETNIREEKREPIAVAYEQTSGNAMFVWGDSTALTVQSRRWLGTSWEASEVTVIDIGEKARWLSLKADPSASSNRLMLVCVDKILDLNTADWNGTTWTAHTEHDTDVDNHNARVADFDWEPSGSKGLLVWGTTADSLSYKTFTAPSTWSGNSTVAAAGTHPWVQLRRNPRNVTGDTKILGSMLNSNFDLGALKWDGSTLTNVGDSAFTSDTTETTYECFDIKFSNFYAEPKVSTEFTFSSMTTNTPTQLNFTVVSHYNVSNVNVTIQVWNYSSSAYVTSGEGYLTYTSTGANVTKVLNITTNPQFYTSNGNAKIKVMGVNLTTTEFQQRINQIKLTYEYNTSSTYDYVLKVVNQVADNWTANLQVYDNSNIGRLSSLNISLHDGTSSNQIAVSGGSIVKSEGDPYDLPGGVNSTIYIGMSNLQATTTDTSYLYIYLKIQVPNTSTYILYVITFEIT